MIHDFAVSVDGQIPANILSQESQAYIIHENPWVTQFFPWGNNSVGFCRFFYSNQASALINSCFWFPEKGGIGDI